MSDQTRDRILKGAEQLFSRYGIRSITMDEVARHLAISKKTLYQFFENKDELVYQVAKTHMDHDCQRWDELHAHGKTALEEMLAVTEMLRQEVRDLNPALVYDLKRFHPRAWSLFEEQKETLFERSIQHNILRGIREGCYRPDVDSKVMSRIRFTLIHISFDPEIFPPEQFEFAHVQMQILEHFVRGLLSEQGLHDWNLMRASHPAGSASHQPAFTSDPARGQLPPTSSLL